MTVDSRKSKGGLLLADKPRGEKQMKKTTV